MHIDHCEITESLQKLPRNNYAIKSLQCHPLSSIVVSFLACYAGNRGSISRRGELFFFNIVFQREIHVYFGSDRLEQIKKKAKEMILLDFS